MRCRLSGVVTTLDNASTLEDCLASLAFCDEIVVLDSGSSDATLAIAARHGARTASQAFAGYGPQKQAAIGLASGDWILLLDADEHLTAAGRSAIERRMGDAIMAAIRNTSTGSKTDHGRTGGTIENGATIVGPNGAKGTLVIADDGTWNVKLGKEVYSLSKGAAIAAGPKEDGTMPSLNGWKAWSYNSKSLATYR